VDLVISCLGLHWTNDLPGAMIQVNFLIQFHLYVSCYYLKNIMLQIFHLLFF
jgi:NADH dehydrogenase [ubiquinone] 1 alpha subcomplex assembly factor 5